MLALILAAAATATGTAADSAPSFRRLGVEPATASATAGFHRLDPSRLGIGFTNRCSPSRYAKRQNLMNGAGVALGDYDGDGWCDIYFCNREGPNALYRNLGGWTFTNVTQSAGVSATNLISSGALFADLNGDGHLDLHVTSFLGPDALFLNRGDGTFEPSTNAGGLATPGGATSSTAADLDGDGDLDVYVARFAVEALLRDGSVITTRMVGGQPVATGRAGRRIRILNSKMYEYGEPDFLFLNDGKGRFTPVTWSERFVDEQGQPLAEPPPDLGFAVQLRDINADGHPDIFVCNDFQTPDRVWLNDGHAHFRALPGTAWRNMSYASMGVDFADIDRDGHLDFYTVEMLPTDQYRHMTHIVRGADPDLRKPRDPFLRDAASRSVLAWNRGDGTYDEIAWFAGVATSDWSWTPVFLDVDLDGYEDLLVSSGYPHDVNDLDSSGGAGRGEGRALSDSFKDELLKYPPLDSPQIAWRNRGDRTFEDASAAWKFDARVVTHGLALADLDNDGDLDVVGNSFNAAPLIYRNESIASRIAVRLSGPRGNSSGTGARIRLLGGPVPIQEQEMLTGGRYLSCDQPQRTFAAHCPSGGSPALTLEVFWRDGHVTKITPVLPNSIYTISAPDSAPPPPPPARTSTPPQRPIFLPATVASMPPHQEAPFDDFARQSLLPWRLSHQGPGVAAFDSDADGRDELAVSDGRGGRIRMMRRDAQDSWTEIVSTAAETPLPDDLLGVLAIAVAPGRHALFAAHSHYESADAKASSVLRWDLAPNGWSRSADLESIGSSPACLAASDLDDDQDLDLVVAGRVIPGDYPKPASTCIFTNDGGTFRLDARASEALRHVGPVSGLLLTDLDGDARSEMVLACEWGPLRIFKRHPEAWREVTHALGLADLTGIWQGLAAGDFDGDGRTDLAAGNWGHNSYQRRTQKGPWRIYYGEFGGRHSAILEAYHHPGYAGFVPVRTRDPLAREFPWLTAAFPRHADFARATVPHLLGEHAAQTAHVEARTLSSVVLLRRDHGFQIVELPTLAQWTPISGFVAADFDLDGDVDLVALQNFFAVRDEEDRLDAGRGLLLLNDGRAGFTPVLTQASGLSILGEQRGGAFTDLNSDQRPDLVVAANGAPLSVWTNQVPAKGVAIRLKGPASNPQAIGASLRVATEGTLGPRFEIRAGSGRLSQDSATLFVPATAREIEVLAPGKPPRSWPIPEGARDLVVDLERGPTAVPR